MPTECSPDLFAFAPVEGRAVVAAFDGGAVTSDAGALLLGATDRVIRLVERFAACFQDHRSADQVEHRIGTLVSQRVFGIALGYEDLIDHDHLRHDPILAALAAKLSARRAACAPLAGKSTLNRLEHAPSSAPTRYHKIGHDPAAIERLLVELFLDAHAAPPKQIVLDLDATDDPLHGRQEGRFFHGYYDGYCYLPLYVFCGRHLLAAKLRRSNIDAIARQKPARSVARRAGGQEIAEGPAPRPRSGELAPRSAPARDGLLTIAALRMDDPPPGGSWPQVRIILRADSGFARDELMMWAENNQVEYLFGLARNARLTAAIAAELAAAEVESRATGKPARRFKDFPWATLESWSRQRRVVAPPRAPARVRSADRIDRLLTVDGRMDRRRGQPALCGHLARPRRA
jgi:hypothetical protein